MSSKRPDGAKEQTIAWVALTAAILTFAAASSQPWTDAVYLLAASSLCLALAALAWVTGKILEGLWYLPGRNDRND